MISDSSALSFPLSASPQQRRAATPEEAAQQFEEIFLKQFARQMTEGLFEAGLAGDEGPGWMGAYGDMQKDVLADELAAHLSRSGALRISEMMLRQWKHDAGTGEPTSPPEAERLPGDPTLKMS